MKIIISLRKDDVTEDDDPLLQIIAGGKFENKAYDYAKNIVSKKITAPKYVIKQCKQFIKIADNKDPKYVINKNKVNQIEAILKLLIMPRIKGRTNNL